MNVMIIDDEPDICFVMAFELKLGGHTSVSCHTAEEAQKSYLANSNIDVIVCDFQMPRMNGLSFFHWVKQNGFTGGFYILTGEPTMDTKKLLEQGITDVMFKPHDLNKISDILK